MRKSNIYDSISDLALPQETFEILFKNNNLKIERIISSGHKSPDGFWYDQEINEWILILEGEARLEFENSEFISLKKGDYLNIPAHIKHRVSYTSNKPKCIWLAVFYE